MKIITLTRKEMRRQFFLGRYLLAISDILLYSSAFAVEKLYDLEKWSFDFCEKSREFSPQELNSFGRVILVSQSI